MGETRHKAPQSLADIMRDRALSQAAQREKSQADTTVIHINDHVRIRPWTLAEARAGTAHGFLLDANASTAHEVWFNRADWALRDKDSSDKDSDILKAAGVTLKPEARDRALDPFANSRSRGEKCDPLLRWSDDLAHVTREPEPAVSSAKASAKSGASAKSSAKSKASATPESAKASATPEARPWEAAGVSRRTWFRRLAEAKVAGQGEAGGLRSKTPARHAKRRAAR